MYSNNQETSRKEADTNTAVKPYSTDRQKLLIDYFERTVGTPEEEPYYELALYTYDDQQLILEEYTGGGSENERCTQTLVPVSTYEEALKVVRNFHLKELLNRKGAGLNGKTYVIKFRESLSDEELYRFSDENVGSEETIMMFPEMHRVLSGAKQNS